MDKYFELVKPTYIENWSKELCSLSLAQCNIELSFKDVVNPLLELIWDQKPTPVVEVLEKRLDDELIKFPKGAFIRLGSRSPKDVDIVPIFKGSEGLNLFFNSVRIFDDLCLASKNRYNPHIFLREWVEIPEWLEFRCFMKDRKLVGISQYYYNKDFLDIINHKDTMEWVIREFFKKFKKASHLDTVVFDVFLKYRQNFKFGVWEGKLLEINPFFEMTDPCLFDWRKKEDFNGEFRFNDIKEKQ
ncbi:MAG: hypothetical protein ACTSWK_17665 [Promethearchaeota archaeon]